MFSYEYYAKYAMQNSKSLTSLPLTLSLTGSLTAIVAEFRATLAGHVKTTIYTIHHVLAPRTALPSLFGSQFLHLFRLFILNTKLARVCF